MQKREGRLRERRGRSGQAQRDFDAGMEFVDVFVQVGFDDPVVVEPESFADRVLGDFETAVHIAPQGSGEEKADGKSQGFGFQPFQ